MAGQRERILIGLANLGVHPAEGRVTLESRRLYILRRMDSGEASDYHAFLLRMQRVRENARPVWRFSLQPPGEGDARYFSTLDGLAAFLHDLMKESGLAPDPPRGQDD